MPYLVALFAGLCVMLLLVALYELSAAPARAVSREIEELRSFQPSPFGAISRRRRQSRKQQVGELIRKLGEHVERGGLDLQGWARRLVQAGYWSPDAPRIFFGARVALAAGFAFAALGIAVALDARLLGMLVLGLWLGGIGWIAPSWYVLRRRNARRTDIHRALADALDLLVACVEAGMGLNQALVRVSDEVRNISEALAEELSMVNLEIRAGAPRADALRNFGERTGIDDVEALVSTLIQTERFGTSVGRALRVQAATLRQKRRQRAEEAAAKTTIKLVFPLVLFVFPALFVVILGPAVIQVIQALGGNVMREVHVFQTSSGVSLAERVAVADSWWRRFRGLLGRPLPEAGEGMLLLRCGSIHTVGMAAPIDVAFLDADGRVVRRLTGIRPWRLGFGGPRAAHALELPAGRLEETGTAPGDRLSWS